MVDRFAARPNGCGGWYIWDRTRKRRVAGEFSHRRNAEITAGRLNGTRDIGQNSWFLVYEVEE
jgi:hypothetical protein